MKVHFNTESTKKGKNGGHGGCGDTSEMGTGAFHRRGAEDAEELQGATGKICGKKKSNCDLKFEI